jgi:hypothetical protein
LEKKKDDLTFFYEYVKEKPSVIMFKEKDNFNYEVGNYGYITIKILSESSTSILN